jgi:hypothetical protein
MDNLRTHKIDGVAQAIKAVGAKPRYLPAYSPDLNPIEQAFSKLKAALRNRKGAAQTHRQAPQDVCARRVRQLLSTCRIWAVTHIRWKMRSTDLQTKETTARPMRVLSALPSRG